MERSSTGCDMLISLLGASAVAVVWPWIVHCINENKTAPQNSHQKLLTGAPHVVHAFEHLPILQKGEKPHVVRALTNGVEAGRGLLRT